MGKQTPAFVGLNSSTFSSTFSSVVGYGVMPFTTAGFAKANAKLILHCWQFMASPRFSVPHFGQMTVSIAIISLLHVQTIINCAVFAHLIYCVSEIRVWPPSWWHRWKWSVLKRCTSGPEPQGRFSCWRKYTTFWSTRQTGVGKAGDKG